MHPALNAFCQSARDALRGSPVDAALDTALATIATQLAALLADAGFIAATFDDATPPGKRQLWQDVETGFLVLAHVQKAGKGGSPHSHGASWAVYGNARGCTEMTEYRRLSAEDDPATVLQALPIYRLDAGQTRAYGPGAIHSTAHPDKAWVLRITGTDLDAIPRYRFHKSTDHVRPAAEAPA